MSKSGKPFFLLLISILLLVFLAACEEETTEETPDPQNAVEAAEVMLEHLNDNDVDAASEYLCDNDVQFLRENPPEDYTPRYTGIDCAGNETIVTCSYNIEIDGRTAERGLTASFDVSEDGKLCAQEE